MNYYPTTYYHQQQPFFTQQQTQNTIQGKIVDSEEMVRATDVPIGGYGVFPKADLSEVYIKTWNGNGTTSVLTFKPVVVQKQEDLHEKIKQLEQKIDDFITSSKRKEF